MRVRFPPGTPRLNELRGIRAAAAQLTHRHSLSRPKTLLLTGIQSVSEERHRFIPSMPLTPKVFARHGGQAEQAGYPLWASLRAPQEAVIHVVIVDGVSRDRPLRVDIPYEGALAGACARARSVERGDLAVVIAHEAVSHTVRVNVVSVNHSRVVDIPPDGALEGARARAGSVERSDDAVVSAHEAVIHIVRVNVNSRNRFRRVDASGVRALAGACARARSVERGESAVGSAQVAVIHIARVNDASRNRPRRVDAILACGNGALEGARAPPGASNVVMVPL